MTNEEKLNECLEAVKNDAQLKADYAKLQDAAKDSIAIKLRSGEVAYSFLDEFHTIGNRINARINEIRESHGITTATDGQVQLEQQCR